MPVKLMFQVFLMHSEIMGLDKTRDFSRRMPVCEELLYSVKEYDGALRQLP